MYRGPVRSYYCLAYVTLARDQSEALVTFHPNRATKTETKYSIRPSSPLTFTRARWKPAMTDAPVASQLVVLGKQRGS
jgi:hypothetical protein